MHGSIRDWNVTVSNTVLQKLIVNNWRNFGHDNGFDIFFDQEKMCIETEEIQVSQNWERYVKYFFKEYVLPLAQNGDFIVIDTYSSGNRKSVRLVKDGENIVCKNGEIIEEPEYFNNEVAHEMREIVAFLTKIKNDAENYGVNTRTLESITFRLDSQYGFSAEELIDLYGKIVVYIERVLRARNEIESATERIREYASMTSHTEINYALLDISSSLVFEPLLHSRLKIARAELEMITQHAKSPIL